MRFSPVALTQAALMVSAVIPSSVVSAQALNRTLDEGTFLISRNGAPIGRESFRITYSQVSGINESYRATAQVAMGDRRIVPTLTCDSTGAPLSYDVSVQGGPDGVRLQARGRPGRFSSMLRTRDGESTREYVVPRGVVVLDDDVLHQLYFVTLRRRSGSLSILAPRAGLQATASLEERGGGPVDIAGNSIAATHFVLSAAGFARREFWIDSAGRILKVSIPERGIVAQRDEPPR
ncbi:MAG TPA: hypothetical protein VJN70_08375 [Gemmatimonadaceae bacterium]|nr:hypothetical protein [Gemmatimonadaceae bacterium]